MPCWGVLLGGLLVVERERAVCGRQLLDCGQRPQRVVHSVSCRDVQREQRVDCVERMLSVPCGRVLLVGLQLVERERVVCCGQLLYAGQRDERFMRALPCWSILPCRLWEQQRERGVRRGQFLVERQWRCCAVL